MVFIREWTYRQLVRIDTGEPWPLWCVLLFVIIVLGVMIDLIG